MSENGKSQSRTNFASAKNKLTVSASKTSQKFRSAGQPAGQTSSSMLGERYSPNPQESTTDPFVPGTQYLPHKRKMDENERSSVSDNDDSVHSNDEKPKPAPGKKTRGRVKIQMEYIQNKLRRYTTFSKRKSGIMKKAYELSTLTGTQVMLLVASETGHVYTFATPKLQPMITSDAGKALIQTCLHSPDPPTSVVNPVMEYDMRMNVSGYEETDLGYAVNEEDFVKHGMVSVCSSGNMPIMNSQGIVTIPQGLMQMPFSGHDTMTTHAIMAQTHPMHIQTLASVSQNLSPHASPPPSYSPPRTYTATPSSYPGSPGPVYSQASQLPHQSVMIDDLGSPNHMGGSPHLGPMEHYDRSPSHSPIQSRYSPHGYSTGSPMTGHSPMRHM